VALGSTSSAAVAVSGLQSSEPGNGTRTAPFPRAMVTFWCDLVRLETRKSTRFMAIEQVRNCHPHHHLPKILHRSGTLHFLLAPAIEVLQDQLRRSRHSSNLCLFQIAARR